MNRNEAFLVESPIGFVTIKKAVELTGASEAWLKARCTDGTIPAIQRQSAKGLLLINVRELNRRIDSGLLVIGVSR